MIYFYFIFQNIFFLNLKLKNQQKPNRKISFNKLGKFNFIFKDHLQRFRHHRRSGILWNLLKPPVVAVASHADAVTALFCSD